MGNPNLQDAQVSQASYHRGSPYEHDETASAVQSSMVFSRPTVFGRWIATGTPVILPSSVLTAATQKSQDDSERPVSEGELDLTEQLF